MNISARIENQQSKHSVLLSTDGREQAVTISPRKDGFGSSVNGGELLFLALATCYCNDIYREARKRGIEVRSVEVEVSGQFGQEGEPASNITYAASVAANAPEEEILALMRHTDSIAEIQNTLRRCSTITLSRCEASTL
jgi:uncharacterized OsmC-like protein